MDFKYTPYFSEGAFDFLYKLDVDDSKLVMLEIRLLANDPAKEPHFTEHDNVGREIRGLVSGNVCILYWIDDAEKEIKISEIRHADR